MLILLLVFVVFHQAEEHNEKMRFFPCRSMDDPELLRYFDEYEPEGHGLCEGSVDFDGFRSSRGSFGFE